MKLQEFFDVVKDNILIIVLIASGFVYLFDNIMDHIKEILEDYYYHKQEMKELELECKENEE